LQAPILVAAVYHSWFNMVDFARIQERIYYGYGKAAVRLGTVHNIYRSATAINPLKPENLLGTEYISIDQNYNYTLAKKYGDPVWQFLMTNGLTLQNYDFMVSPDGVNYFIIDIVPDNRLNPPTCVECNSTISIFSTSSTLTTGNNSYQAYDPFKAPKIYENCPVSILQHAKTDTQTLKLPTSVKLPYYQIIVPELGNSLPKIGDVLLDDKGRRMAIINSEKTKKSLGFRLVAGELGA